MSRLERANKEWERVGAPQPPAAPESDGRESSSRVAIVCGPDTTVLADTVEALLAEAKGFSSAD